MLKKHTNSPIQEKEVSRLMKDPKIYVGTCFFNSKENAIKYYKAQECDSEYVDTLIKENSITIGKPPESPDYTIRWNREEGRYFLEYLPDRF